jgi:hypothetical protein
MAFMLQKEAANPAARLIAAKAPFVHRTQWRIPVSVWLAQFQSCPPVN